ncbi:MAG: hypothetical protein ACREOO_03650 [bacterium]
MLAGHFAVGLALKARYHKVPLLAFLCSALLLDWILLVLVWQDVEHFRLVVMANGLRQLDLHDAVYSHSLFWSLFYAVVTFLVFVRAEGERHWAVPLGLGVFSHWVLDALFYDHLPFANFGPRTDFGLGWASLSSVLAFGCESVVVLAGWWIYFHSRRVPTSAQWPFWGVLMVLILMLFLNPLLLHILK